MDILTKFLTVVLFLNCLFLILLVLVQLPKKEAGLGTAFGGGTTDALFGAGAGTALSKLTKWNAILFLVLCLFLSLPFMRPDDLSDQLGQGGAPTTNTNAAPSQPVPSPIQQAPAPTPRTAATPASMPPFPWIPPPAPPHRRRRSHPSHQ